MEQNCVTVFWTANIMSWSPWRCVLVPYPLVARTPYTRWRRTSILPTPPPPTSLPNNWWSCLHTNMRGECPRWTRSTACPSTPQRRWRVHTDTHTYTSVEDLQYPQTIFPHPSPCPLYPVLSLLQVLWDENVVPMEFFSGEGCLALPKLNLQFLTLHDYLLRNFILFRLESTCKCGSRSCA